MIDVSDDFILNCALQFQNIYKDVIMATRDYNLENKTIANRVKTRTLTQILVEYNL